MDKIVWAQWMSEWLTKVKTDEHVLCPLETGYHQEYLQHTRLSIWFIWSACVVKSIKMFSDFSPASSMHISWALRATALMSSWPGRSKKYSSDIIIIINLAMNLSLMIMGCQHHTLTSHYTFINLNKYKPTVVNLTGSAFVTAETKKKSPQVI